jgi:catechol 2,3-dioxygenase-like lactoylglutathione lyase family enzyme
MEARGRPSSRSHNVRSRRYDACLSARIAAPDVAPSRCHAWSVAAPCRLAPSSATAEDGLMSIGSLRCVVINVTDLAVAYRFWSEVTGLEVIGSEHGWHGWLGYLGTRDPWKHEIILQQVGASPVEAGAPNEARTNAVHVDISPNDGIDKAIEQVIELGGRVKKPPSLIPDHDHMVTNHPCWTGRSCRTRSATSSVSWSRSPKTSRRRRWPRTRPPTSSGGSPPESPDSRDPAGPGQLPTFATPVVGGTTRRQRQTRMFERRRRVDDD